MHKDIAFEFASAISPVFKLYLIKELEEKLYRCRDINLDDVDEISYIKIDRRKSSNERIIDFLTKVKNLYVFKVNGKLIRFSFSEKGSTAEECFTRVLKNLYR